MIVKIVRYFILCTWYFTKIFAKNSNIHARIYNIMLIIMNLKWPNLSAMTKNSSTVKIEKLENLVKRAEDFWQKLECYIRNNFTLLSIYFCPCHDEVSENQLNLFSRISTICWVTTLYFKSLDTKIPSSLKWFWYINIFWGFPLALPSILKESVIHW